MRAATWGRSSTTRCCLPGTPPGERSSSRTPASCGWCPRLIQHQPHAYARTAALLGDAAGAGLRVLFSHDTDDTRVVLP
jgi:hypothetical protein